MASFYVENFGCRATQADGAAVERQFRERGLVRAGHASEAEVVVLNTCTVTASADRDARAAIRRVRRENPGCQIVVTGCYAQRAPEEIAALPGVSQVIGNSHKHRLAEIVLGRSENVEGFVPLSSLLVRQRPFVACPEPNGEGTNDQQPALSRTAKGPIYVSDIFAHTELLAAPVFDAANERTRPNLKVQDGCDNRCSFCVIPSVRGQSRSLPLHQILAEVNTLVAAGYREIVISGINLGRWGRDLLIPPDEEPKLGQRPTANDQRPIFLALIHALLERTTLEKLRISSVEPMDWTDELIQLIADSPRIAKHAHVPMQSGSDRVLRAMHRKYRPWHYRQKIEKIRTAMPQAAIGADVMVGFPGETDHDFEETRRMVEDLPFTYLHVFTYSPRPGTPAAAMRNQVPTNVARARNKVLRDLAAEKKLAFMKSFVGQTLEAITLNDFDGTYTECLTDNYLPLRMAGRHEPNRWIQAQIEDVQGDTLIAKSIGTIPPAPAGCPPPRQAERC